MSSMKRSLAAAAILLLASLAATAEPRPRAKFDNPLLDDVVEMTAADVPEATIMAFVRARGARLESEVSAKDVHRMGADQGPSWTYVVLDAPDAHYEQAKAAGAEIVQDLRDEEYGSRGYTARDPGGNLWTFGTYRPAA